MIPHRRSEPRSVSDYVLSQLWLGDDNTKEMLSVSCALDDITQKTSDTELNVVRQQPNKVSLAGTATSIKHVFCRDKSMFVATNVLCDKHNLSRRI